MNYLAHIHLAQLTVTSKLGNFLGDFAKGSRLDYLPEDIQQGIKLHRSIDSFTDHHNSIVSLREIFPSALRRMSGIVIDIYFDHLLCTHWSKFDDTSLSDTLADFYHELKTRPIQVRGRFDDVKSALLEHQWLENYTHRESCIRAFYQIERRLQGKISFAQAADSFLLEQHSEFERTFLLFYPKLIEHAHTRAR
jgi:acyl carrier protein phosphodiesterase